MAFKQRSPIPITEGGTNATTFTHLQGVLIYNGIRTVTIPTTAAGKVLTSNGLILAPTFQDVPASGIQTLNGNSGSATGSTITLQGNSNMTTTAAGATV